MKISVVVFSFMLLVFLTACSTPWMTNTTRNAVEQYLLSTTVERAVSSMVFEKYANKKAFLDYEYFTPQTDKAYAQGVLESRLAQFYDQEADVLFGNFLIVRDFTDHARPVSNAV